MSWSKNTQVRQLRGLLTPIDINTQGIRSFGIRIMIILASSRIFSNIFHHPVLQGISRSLYLYRAKQTRQTSLEQAAWARKNKQHPRWNGKCKGAVRLFQLLLWSQLVSVTALSLSAVGGSRRQSGVALTADGLLTVVLGSQGFQRWFNHGVLVSMRREGKEVFWR